MFTMKPDITPIWTLNELAGKHSAVSMWTAAEFDFRGVSPSYYEPFNRTTHWKDRINKIIPLLKRNESQIDFVMFYAEQPDFQSHSFSSISKQVIRLIQQYKMRDRDSIVLFCSIIYWE